jgi:hypothetical protein
MADLLLHSMAEFADLILPALETAGANHVVEIGAEDGGMSRPLIEALAARGGRLTAIDPAPSEAAVAAFRGVPNAELVRKTSLEAIPSLDADAWLVDGDHNYYTVRRESELIFERCRANGRPFLVFYHDVSWPWARRDLYYAPERIPAEHRHPFAWDMGVHLHDPIVAPGGFRGEGAWACAIREGGDRNGVLTAVEDFAASCPEPLEWIAVPAVFGLGVLFSARAPWSAALLEALGPYHWNPLLARMELNRLECYLRVIALQDEAHAARSA